MGLMSVCKVKGSPGVVRPQFVFGLNKLNIISKLTRCW